MKKSIEQKIAETDELLRQIVGNCELNVSIVELILRNIYTEVKILADENVQKRVKEFNGDIANAEIDSAESEGDDLKDDNTGN